MAQAQVLNNVSQPQPLNGSGSSLTGSMGSLTLDSSAAVASAGGNGPVSPQRLQWGQEQLQPHSHQLHAIVETDNDEVSSNTGDEGALDDSDGEERREIGGDMLREMAVKSGYLLKKGERRKNWKKRYFVLRPDRLCYYKNEKEYQILRNISIADVHACAQVEVKKHDNSFGIVTAKRTYYVRAETRHEADDWVLKINRTRKEQEARLAAEKDKESSNNTPLAGTPYPAQSETDLPQSIEQQAQLPLSAPVHTQQSQPIAIRTPGGLAPISIVSPASDSAGFLSTSASSSAAGGSGANYLSSSWASSSSEQSNPAFQPKAFGRTGTFRAESSSNPPASEASSSAVSGGEWPNILPAQAANGLLNTDGGLVDDPRLLPPVDTSLPATGRERSHSNVLSSSDEDEVPTPSGPHSTSPPKPVIASSGLQTSPQGAGAAANTQRVILAGYLMKQGKRKTWRKRWFSLYSNRLVYTRSHMDRKVHREIRLDSILEAMECDEPKSKGRTFGSIPLSPGLPNSPPSFLPASADAQASAGAGASEAGMGESSNCFKIITPSRSYVVCAPSEEEEIKWLSAIRVLLDKKRAATHPTAQP